MEGRKEAEEAKDRSPHLKLKLCRRKMLAEMLRASAARRKIWRGCGGGGGRGGWGGAEPGVGNKPENAPT